MTKDEATLPATFPERPAVSVNRLILSAAVIVGILTLAGKILAMGKEMFVASWFGTDDSLDAFLIGFLLPSYAINVIAGSIEAALVPVYVEVRDTEGPEAAQRLFSGTLVLSIGLLSLATVVLAAAAPAVIPLLCSGFSPEKTRLTLHLFYLFLPGVLLAGLGIHCEAALNAGESFAVAALAPSVVPVAMILVLKFWGARWGIHALAAGMAGGFVVQLAVVAYALRRRGLSFTPRWHGYEPRVRRAVSQYLPAALASALMCSSVLVDQSMAGMLSSGSVAALNYGNKCVALLLTIGTMALGTAVLPYFSRMVAAADWAGIRHTLKTYIRLIVLATAPLTIAGVVFSRPLVALLFQRGHFTGADTMAVARIQALLLLQVPFYTLVILFVRMISSLQANQVLMWGTVISFGVNISLNWVLMRFMGVAGIALSTSIVYMILALFLGIVLWRKLEAVAAA